MKLRSIHPLHHISAIKGGKVVKTLNVTRGRPILSFKEISTILDHGSNTKVIPLADRSFHKVFDPNMVKSEEEIVNENSIGGSSDKRSHDLDDSFLGEMTLKQLKKKYKAKKRKLTRSVDKEVEQDNGGSLLEEDNIDLEETLGSLKHKASGKSKSRKVQKCGSGLKITDVVVKCESVSFDEDSLQLGSGFDMCATIRVEDSESGCSLFKEVTCSDDFYSNEHGMASTGKAIGEMQVTGESCNTEEDSLIIVEGPNVSYADPVSCEHHTTAKSLLPEIPVCEEMMKVDDRAIIEKVASELPDPDYCSPREESLFIAEEYKVCNLNQIRYELEDHSGDSCLPPESSSHEEALKVGDPVMAVEQPVSMLALTQEDKATTDALICNESPDILFSLCDGSGRDDYCTTYSHENTSPMHISMSPESDEQPLCMAASSHMQAVKSSSDGGACTTMDGNKEYMIPRSLATSVNSPKSVLKETTRCSRLMDHVSEAVPGNCGVPVMVEVDSMDDNDKVSSSFAASESVERRHPPERLLSARKIISPDSQQKLCRAMKSLDLPDYQETDKCKQRLCLEKQEVNADARSDAGRDQLLTRSTAPEHSNSADTSPNSEQIKTKGKEDKKRVRAKGVSKVALPAWYRISSACGCIQSCSQNVVDFSQQQMTDTERLALNLTKELKSMKELMIEMLHPQGRRAPTSRFNINEVRVAVENATKVEDMARRCLATMTRDCNRFCKIVSLAEKNTASVGNKPDKEEAENDATSVEDRPDKGEASDSDATNSASKGRKKITFADESGGSLCDVRLIEDRESVLLDSPIENGELHSA